MRHSVLFAAVLSALSFASNVQAEEAKSEWTATTNVGIVSNYYARGVSQSWNMPAVQGGVDITHSSGFYVGAFGSSISERTYVGASTELDLYAGYNGTVPGVEDLGWTVGGIGYFYPGGGWDKYNLLTLDSGKKVREDFTTYEGNVGLSYKWLSAKASMTIGEWFGANRNTGWTKSSSGTTYVELNANYPLEIWDLTLVAHVGRLDVKGELDGSRFPNANGVTAGEETKADMTDYKIGLSKAFKVAGSDGWNAGVYYIGGTNGGTRGYWGAVYGGASFTDTPGYKDLSDDSVVVSLSRTF